MKRTAIVSVAIVIVALAFGLVLNSRGTTAESGNQSALAWKNFDEGFALAAKTNKKILVDVYTDWCTWCKKMDSDVYTQKDVIAALNAGFVLVKLNAESDKPLLYKEKKLSEAQFASAVGVTGYPSTLFFESTGKAITLLPGFVPAPKFVPILRYISEDHYKTTPFEEYLSKAGSPSP